MVLRISSSRPMTGSSFCARACSVRSRAYFFNASKPASAFGLVTFRPLRMPSSARSIDCGLAPFARNARPPAVSLAARAASTRSCATYSSPACAAACCAASSTRTSSGVICGAPAPAPCTFGCRPISASHAVFTPLRIAAGSPDQPGRGPLLVIQERLQHMLGRDPLIEFANRDRLRSLQEAARALGQFFHVHGSASLIRRRAPRVPQQATRPALSAADLG